MTRDFDWFDELYAVVKEDGSFAGIPCTNWGEARELQAQHEGSKVFKLKYDNCNFEDWLIDGDEPNNIDDDCGFDPYLGCFTDDC